MEPKYPRHCGACRECCIHVGVQEFNKPAGKPCDKLCAKGCSIYEDRPDGCRKFVCVWYQGGFGPNERPNQTGVVCWVARTGIMVTDDGEKVLTLFVSHRPGKKLSKKMMSWLKGQSYRFPVIVTPMKGNHPKHRTIWWQGKVVTEIECKQWYR